MQFKAINNCRTVCVPHFFDSVLLALQLCNSSRWCPEVKYFMTKIR